MMDLLKFVLTALFWATLDLHMCFTNPFWSTCLFIVFLTYPRAISAHWRNNINKLQDSIRFSQQMLIFPIGFNLLVCYHGGSNMSFSDLSFYILCNINSFMYLHWRMNFWCAIVVPDTMVLLINAWKQTHR